MTPTNVVKQEIKSGLFDSALVKLYSGVPPDVCKHRYIEAIESFEELFGTDRDVIIVSAPGRTEIGGNHTDHQRGVVLAGAVNLDCLCIVSPNDSSVVHIKSKGHAADHIDIGNMTPRPEEEGHAGALIRGVVSWFKMHGFSAGGLDAYTTSDVLAGSGLSSSAAFETALGGMFNYLYNNGKVDPISIAMAGQYAENNFFGKPSGLMDQMACSVGGFVEIDFKDPASPVVNPVCFDFMSAGYHLCIVDTKGSHGDLNDAYASIPSEMRAVAEAFGKRYLREVDEEQFKSRIAEARQAAGDRAVLRAMHFFSDNRRAGDEAAALRAGDFDSFLRLVVASGESSVSCLQNIYAYPDQQGLSLALALSRSILEGCGAWRIHGGGFAGTIQAFVPDKLLAEYISRIDAVFGDGACHVLSIRPVGGILVERN